MVEIAVKKLCDNAIIPKKMSQHAAGYDLYAANQDAIILKKGEALAVPTGLAMSIPIGYEGQIRPRSGLALKHYISVLNAPGTIDADYRGEIKIILFNAGKEDFSIEPGMRVAQMIISKCADVDFIVCAELDDTSRGEGGFGHTSLK
jgi:dUTP pyrophosphatase